MHFTRPQSVLYISILAATVVVAAPVSDRLKTREDLTTYSGVNISSLFPISHKRSTTNSRSISTAP